MPLGALHKLRRLATNQARLGRCAACDYPLADLPENRCPECNRPFDPFDPATMNMTGRPYTAWQRRLLAPPTWIWLLAGVGVTLWHLWFTALDDGVKLQARVAEVWAFLGAATLALYIGHWRTIRKLRPPPDLYRNRIRSFWALPLLFGIAVALSYTSLPFQAVFWISRPFLDTMARSIHEEPLRRVYPDRYVGLLPARDAYATPDEICFTTDRWYRFRLLYAPHLGRRNATYQAIAYRHLGGDWYCSNDAPYLDLDAAAAHLRALERLADDPQLARRHLPFILEFLQTDSFPPGHRWTDRIYTTAPLPIEPNRSITGRFPATSHITAQPRAWSDGNLLRPDIRAMVALGSDAVPALRQLVSSTHAPARRRAAIIAMEMRADAGALVPELTTLLADEDAGCREMAAAALGAIGPAALPATPDLLKCLSDPQIGVRYNSARALCLIKPTLEQFPQLWMAEVAYTQPAPLEPSPPWRFEYDQSALKHLPRELERLLNKPTAATPRAPRIPPQPVPDLSADLLLPQNPARATPEETLRVLRALLDSQPSDRCDAAQRIGQMGSAAIPALPDLQRHARFDLDWRVRAVADQAIGEIIRASPTALPTAPP
jgi:hypothetical protein